jgi:hypothetical protein
MWQNIFETVPTNNQVVWIRVLGVYGQLALAKYKTSSQEFTVITTNVVIPIFFVSRWKAQ